MNGVKRVVVRPLEVLSALGRILPRELDLEFEPRRQVYEFFEGYNLRIKEVLTSLAERGSRYVADQLVSLKARNVEAVEEFREAFRLGSPPPRVDLNSPPAESLAKLFNDFPTAPPEKKCPLSRQIYLDGALLLADYDVADSVFEEALTIIDRATLPDLYNRSQHLHNVWRRRPFFVELRDLARTLRSRNGNGQLAAPAVQMWKGQLVDTPTKKGVKPMALPTPSDPPNEERDPQFAADFFWWLDTHAGNPPPECQGKFVLLYDHQIRHIADTEEACLVAVRETGLEGKHYVIMAVGVRPERELLEIPM